MFFYLLAGILSASVSAQTWQLSDFPVTSVGGVFATEADVCYAAFSDNNYGPGEAVSKDAATTWTTKNGGSLNTDIAKDSTGNGVMSSIGKIYISEGGGPYQVPDGRDITFSQNVETLGEGAFGVSGSHYPNGIASEVINGVGLTTDAGKTWTYHDTGLNWETYVARYSAFPSATTWYVAQGSWGVESTPDPNRTRWEVNSRIFHDGKGYQYRKAVTSDVRHGAISKTIDGGESFTMVYNTQGQYYMNSISCSTTEICMAVAENPYEAVALRTENGGKTWETKITLSDNKMASLMGCKMLSDDEVWISGGTFDGGLVGWYLHSTNGGETWDRQDLAKGYSIDLSFAGGTGYSPGSSETASNIAVYK